MILNSWGLKGSRKSAGGLTTKVLKGQTVASQKRAKGQSNPSPQYLQSQAAAAILNEIFHKIKPGVNLGFTSKRTTENAWNAFYRYNYKNAFDLSSPPAVTLEHTNLLVAKGVITPTPNTSAPVADQSLATITLNWSPDIVDETQSSEDALYMIVYNSSQNMWVYIQYLGLRSDGGSPLPVDMPDGSLIAGNTIYVYTFFVRTDVLGNPVGPASNSVAASVTVIA